jgi:PAS domain-containing protein
MRKSGGAGTGVSRPGADVAGARDADQRPPVPERVTREQVLAFAGAVPAAVYVLGDETDDSDKLRLVETAGGAAALYGLPESYALSGRSPAADAFWSGRPLWLDSAELDAYREKGSGTPPAAVSLGALPLGADGIRLGCLVVVDDVGDGFDAERRNFLELYADEIATWLQAVGAGGVAGVRGEPNNHAIGRTAPRPVLGPALDRLRVGSFTLVLSTGRIDADARVLDLVDIPRQDFDGRVETLLAHTVPDDLPALMSIVEPGHMTSGGRELEFRIRRPTGELRWLRLRCRVLPYGGGRPEGCSAWSPTPRICGPARTRSTGCSGCPSRSPTRRASGTSAGWWSRPCATRWEPIGWLSPRWSRTGWWSPSWTHRNPMPGRSSGGRNGAPNGPTCPSAPCPR